MRRLALFVMVVAAMGVASPAMAGPVEDLTTYLGIRDVVLPDPDPNVDPDVENIVIPPSCFGGEETAGVCVGGTVEVSDHTVGECLYLGGTGCYPVYVDVPLPDGAHVGCSGWYLGNQFYCARGVELP